jgi:hypothetical protein
MAEMLVRTAAVGRRSVSVVRLEDRRGGGAGTSAPTEWCYQKQLEDVLYDCSYGRSTGAMNKLLGRSTAGTAPNLALKRASIAAGLVTQDEFEWLYNHLHDSVRSFTLVPLSSLEAALETYGANARSEALVAALGLARPAAWEDSVAAEESEGEEAGGEEEQEEEASEGDEEAGDGDDGDDSDSGTGAGGTGGSSDGEEEEDDEEESEDMDDGEVSVAPTEVVEGEPPTVDAMSAASPAAKKRRMGRYALVETPALTTELDAFEIHRAAPLLAARAGVAVTAATRKSDRGCALRLLGWLDGLGKLPQPATVRLFASPQIANVVERFVKLHCDPSMAQGPPRSYKWAANHVGSFLALTRYVGTRTEVAPSVLAQLEALHKQTLQQSRVQTKFAVGKAPAAWLDWPAVLRARVAAEKAVAAYDGDDLDQRLALTRTVLLMRLHSDQPPCALAATQTLAPASPAVALTVGFVFVGGSDRVGVLRTLRLGSTLRRDEDGDGGWLLCLSEPEAHKTSKIFGCSKTALNATCATWLDRYLTLACVPDGGYLIHADGEAPTAPLSPQDWTRLVQRAFAAHTPARVKLCPKDLRASYITFLRSSEVEDDLVRETAIAMRHSSTTAAVRRDRTLPTPAPIPSVSHALPSPLACVQSAAYDKNGTQPFVDRAMKATAAFSAKFVA